ncbi:hypothetical protein OAL18_00085 [bacterium]|nr:hypothetical protein [bacterium]
MPDSAFGFHIKTPSANVVDYGTRFAVSVHESTCAAHTQVIEVLVRVEYLQSDEVAELSTGQRNTVVGQTVLRRYMTLCTNTKPWQCNRLAMFQSGPYGNQQRMPKQAA